MNYQDMQPTDLLAESTSANSATGRRLFRATGDDRWHPNPIKECLLKLQVPTLCTNMMPPSEKGISYGFHNSQKDRCA